MFRMERRGFLQLLTAGVAGIALETAIPLTRVWSFPKRIIISRRSEEEIREQYLMPAGVQLAQEVDSRCALFATKPAHVQFVRAWDPTNARYVSRLDVWYDWPTVPIVPSAVENCHQITVSESRVEDAIKSISKDFPGGPPPMWAFERHGAAVPEVRGIHYFS